MFDRLSEFAGHWTFEVVELTGLLRSRPVAPGLPSRLTGKSLMVVTPPADGGMRHGALETMRQYGRERLVFKWVQAYGAPKERVTRATDNHRRRQQRTTLSLARVARAQGKIDRTNARPLCRGR
jgi:hypothetical protein